MSAISLLFEPISERQIYLEKNKIFKKKGLLQRKLIFNCMPAFFLEFSLYFTSQ